MDFPRFSQAVGVEPIGACCRGVPCTDGLTESACLAIGGQFRKGCLCNQFVCSDIDNPGTIGACCQSYQREDVPEECAIQPRYGTRCSRATKSGCEGVGGIWLGATHRCCEGFTEPQPNTAIRRCPLPVEYGRCCHGNPRICCDGYLESDCPDGDWESGKYCSNANEFGTEVPYECPPVGACCIAGVCSLKTRVRCEELFGEWRGQSTCDGVDCFIDIPPDGPGCRSAMVNYGRPNLPRSLILCHPVLMSLTIRDSRHPAMPPNESAGGRGFFEPVSIHPIRAVEPDYNIDSEEPCRRHFGGLVLGGDGFFHPYVASQTLHGDTDSIELSIGAMVILPKAKARFAKQEDGFDAGVFVYIAMYHTPFWTEAHMHSRDNRCVLPV